MSLEDGEDLGFRKVETKRAHGYFEFMVVDSLVFI